MDITFDYWADINPGLSVFEAKNAKDPDSRSFKLQEAHKTLWSKPLPNGNLFDLQLSKGTQLAWGKFRLSSDSIGNSYMVNNRMAEIVLSHQKDAEEIFKASSQIGGFVLFPAYRVDGKNTINGARGMNSKIADRMDLTLEAIRLHYLKKESPLSEVLNRYSDFFSLFTDFKGYVDFWLMDDLVDENYNVKFYLPFTHFETNGYPKDGKEYLELKQATVTFLTNRTQRIRKYLDKA